MKSSCFLAKTEPRACSYSFPKFSENAYPGCSDEVCSFVFIACTEFFRHVN